MTQGEYEKYCRAAKSEERYLSEDDAFYRVKNLVDKYSAPLYISREDWFENQLEVASYLGLDWEDLYVKELNLENLFRANAFERV